MKRPAILGNYDSQTDRQTDRKDGQNGQTESERIFTSINENLTTNIEHQNNEIFKIIFVCVCVCLTYRMYQIRSWPNM